MAEGLRPSVGLLEGAACEFVLGSLLAFFVLWAGQLRSRCVEPNFQPPALHCTCSACTRLLQVLACLFKQPSRAWPVPPAHPHTAAC